MRVWALGALGLEPRGDTRGVGYLVGYPAGFGVLEATAGPRGAVGCGL